MSKFPEVRSAARHSFDRSEWSNAHGLSCPEHTKTIQSHAEDADINNIVRNFGITGRLPENVRVPDFGDFDVVTDYRQAIEAVREAEKSFMSMPSELRDRLGNNPQRFLEYCANPENHDEMRKFGLMVPKPPETPAV